MGASTLGNVLQCDALLPHAEHFFTASSLRLKDRPDEWQSIASRAGVAPGNLRLLRQVHGRSVVLVPTGIDDAPWQPPEADAAITGNPAVALSSRWRTAHRSCSLTLGERQ